MRSNVKPCPKRKIYKKQNFVEKPKIDIESPSCKQRSWIEFNKGYYFPIFEFNFNKQKLQKDKN